MASFFIYALLLISLLDNKPSPTIVHISTWLASLTIELILLAATFALYTSDHHEPKAGQPAGGRLRHGVSKWETAEILVDLFRSIFLFAMVFSYALFASFHSTESKEIPWRENGSIHDTRSLLNGAQSEHNNRNYGTTSQVETKEEVPRWARPEKLPSKTWWEYVRGYSLFFPYLWPKKSLKLQITVVICFVLVLVARMVNVLVPPQVGIITNILSGDNGDNSRIPWGPICLFIFYKVLQGSSGLLEALRSTLWIPINQYSYQELTTASFEHVHGLSLDFHFNKKTGEVLSALSKGNSINSFLEQVTFRVFPMLIDLGVAIGYFLIAFDAYYALVVAIVAFAYLYLTIRLAQWRAEIRRVMVNADRQQDAVK